MSVTSLDMTVRVGCRLRFRTSAPTPILLVLRPRLDGQPSVRHERFELTPSLPTHQFEDAHGNIVCRSLLQPGETVVLHDALVAVPSYPDDYDQGHYPTPIGDIPPLALRYTLPSRYCDSDKLLDFAWDLFGQIPNGSERVHAICDWVHDNIEYRYGSGRPDISASEVIAQRYGVCRDFAHVALTLCRCFNLPARYVTGHLPDIGFLDPGTAMDFHAYFEVYLEGRWCTFDARFNVPRIGRVKVAQGLDAVDGAFSTIYGEAKLTLFQVWAFQVDPKVVSIDDPVDVSKRLDGTPEIRFS